MQKQTEMNREQEALASLFDELGMGDEEIVIKSAEHEEQSALVEEGEEAVDLASIAQQLEEKERLEAAYDAPEPVTEEPEFAPGAEIDPTALFGEEASVPEVKTESAEPAKKKGREKKEKPEKKAVEPRKHYASKTERISDRMGEKLNDFSLLELSDAEEGTDIAKKREELLATMKAAGVKVQNRMTFFIEYVSGRTSALNNVCKIATNLLIEEGKITTGEKGNLLRKLVANPYSVGSAKAMGGNTLLAMQKLKIVKEGAKGEWVANPDSLYLIKLRSMGA